MGKTILTKEQQTALRAVSSEPNLSSFYLSGGTALAEFYLHHRFSEDLDFFTASAEVSSIFLESFVQKLRQEIQSEQVRYERLFDRRLFFFSLPSGELKIEFTHYPFSRLDEFELQHGVSVDSFRDIAANKLAALLDRFEPKDFVDLYFILQQRQLKDVCHDAEQKFGFTISPLFLGSALAKVRRIEALPRLIIPVTIAELKNFFSKEALVLGKDILE